ncbi:hypothetical protein GYMLUDRAFT_252342 [Collybiopsis luxurians FD-317 M1]|uniref:Nucleoplasmin-like domain-containing protein n=1 Tax=Collybiopsis luxurians FD-317 M1 TaxID=944289 RepID=A0A0D0ALQ9_9AGAR|nr:hypothetical protein GYMLUDRAFT_252342 [Collybiopsis luxurians FD-317 M1]
MTIAKWATLIVRPSPWNVLLRADHKTLLKDIVPLSWTELHFRRAALPHDITDTQARTTLSLKSESTHLSDEVPLTLCTLVPEKIETSDLNVKVPANKGKTWYLLVQGPNPINLFGELRFLGAATTRVETEFSAQAESAASHSTLPSSISSLTDATGGLPPSSPPITSSSSSLSSFNSSKPTSILPDHQLNSAHKSSSSSHSQSFCSVNASEGLPLCSSPSTHLSPVHSTDTLLYHPPSSLLQSILPSSQPSQTSWGNIPQCSSHMETRDPRIHQSLAKADTSPGDTEPSLLHQTSNLPVQIQIKQESPDSLALQATQVAALLDTFQKITP